MLRNLLLLCLGITLSNARLNAQELINWHKDLNEARQISQQYKVPVLIHFYGDNCVPCKTLEKNVFTRPEVASTMQRYFVPVHINATQDRRAAAQFGVHSWPTDVFVSPDGKILTQGVCNQNANTYLQNLQSVAVMNRDRNLMLAGNMPPGMNASPAANAQTGIPPHGPAAAGAPAAPSANPYAAPQASNLPNGHPANTFATTAQPGQAADGAPYGRLATSSLQQEAPGRDQAPAPYTNPSSGPTPYASASNAPALAAQSTLPSPTWNGQSAHGQAASGLASAGPLSSTSSMTAPQATPGTSQDHKDVNLPQSGQWSPGSPQPHASRQAPAPALAPVGSAGEKVAMNPGLAAAPTMPPAPRPAAKLASSAFAGGVSPAVSSPQGSVVNNPHFAAGASMAAAAQSSTVGSGEDFGQPALGSRSPAAQMVSADGSVEKITSVAGPKQPASVPALSGYCPVALHASSQWLEGQPQYAVRHRGRVYFLSSQEAAQQFLSAPDTYCPVLSGYDPLVLLRDGALVEGSVYTGLKDATQNRIMLFSSPENKKYFQENYDRLATELDNLLQPAGTRTAAAPANGLQR